MNNEVEQVFITPPSSPGRLEIIKWRAQIEGTWAPRVGELKNQLRSARIEELINQQRENIMLEAPVQQPVNTATQVSGEFSSAGNLSFFVAQVQTDESRNEYEYNEASKVGATF